MNAVDKGRITDAIESFWKIDDRRLAAYLDWFDRKGVTVDQALAAVDHCADTSKYLPKPAEFYEALRAIGAVGEPALGTGDRRVVEAMKARIVAGVADACELRDQHFRERLEQEFDAARQYQAEDLERDLGSADYWRDRIQAFSELMRGDLEEAM